uniref:FRIGIDA-like protein n=1 Tax=Araucaria cunninghamii TaxID=56994 RepID=A0A0D6R4M1_ARACU
MTDVESIVAAMESTASKKEQLQKAFEELSAHKDAMQSCTIEWQELDEHFSYIDEALKKKLDCLVEKEKAFETKASETRKVLEKRDEEVAAKEQSSLARVQEQKDIAVSAIRDACPKQMEAPLDSSAKIDEDAENKVNDSPVVMDIESNVPTSDKEEKSPAKSGASKPGAASEVKPRSQLKQFCEQMDAKGLLKYISENRKFLAALREEVPAALRLAMDPARLVLDALEGFYPPNLKSNQGNKTETGLPAKRRSCILLLESLVPLLVDSTTGHDLPDAASDIKEQAKIIADDWKSKLADVDIDASNGNSLEAQAFLQLLATFGIASDYDEEELCKLVLAVSRRRQTPELCQSLGLAAKMPGVVEVLIDSGKQIEAVNFAHTFGLVDKYPPVPLLKSYLKDARKAAQVKSGNTSVAAQNEANARELFALKAVIKCIEEHKLESEYPLDTLRKRVLQLEKAKADKKRSAETGKIQPKKPRAGGYMPSPVGVDRTGGYASANNVYRSADRIPYPNAAVGASAYSLPGQSSYDRSSQGMYGQSSLPRSYMYSSDNLGSSGLGSSSYNAASSYGGYHLGSGLPSTYPSSSYPSSNYPSSYLQ